MRDTFQDRLTRSADAKKALLDRFRSAPGPDDPEVAARIAERQAIADARRERMAKREAERLAREAAAAEVRRREEEAAAQARREAEELAAKKAAE